MSENLLPMPHMHTLLEQQEPEFRFHAGNGFVGWQARARRKLYELLGIPEIEKYAADPALSVEYDRVCASDGFREIRFRFTSEENVSVPCHLLVPLDVKKPLPTVICLQGHSTGMHISLRRPKYPGDEETCLGGDRDFAYRAVKEGICAVTLEQRCFGECGGTPDGPDCRQAAMRALLLGRTLIGERVWDVSRLINVLESDFSDYVDIKKIICMGNSGGGTTTIYASALDTRIAVSIPSCAVCTYADSIGAMLHCECNFVPGIAKYFDMGELCGMVAPRMLIVVSGRQDGIFPIAGAEKCVADAKPIFAAAGSPENIAHVIGGQGHRFYADDTWPVIHGFLSRLGHPAL